MVRSLFISVHYYCTQLYHEQALYFSMSNIFSAEIARNIGHLSQSKKVKD